VKIKLISRTNPIIKISFQILDRWLKIVMIFNSREGENNFDIERLTFYIEING
jgi:hypothetical protein